MASYRARALAIHSLVKQYRHELESTLARSLSDKMLAIELGVDIANKLLYCFLISQEMFDQIDEQLNQYVTTVKAEPHAINMMLLRVLDVFRQLEAHSRRWVDHYG